MFIQMTKIQSLVALALVIVPAAALAQTPNERIDRAMSRAQEVGLPVSLLESKVAEGWAKGVALDRIATAVETRLKNLELASSIMGRGGLDLDAAQLSVGADAIGAGVTEAVLEKITAATTHEHRSVAVVALTQLVLHGTAPEAALLRVKDALARGPQTLASLATQPGAPSSRRPEAGGSRGGNRGAGGAPVPAPPRQAGPPATPSGGRGPGRGGR